VKTVTIKPFQSYVVTEDGGVINSRTNRALRQDLNSSGYPRVTLHEKGEKLRITVHRLVCLCYHGEHNGLVVNHKDGVKTNNHYSNLEWTTQSENRKHAFKRGLCKRSNSYLNDQIVHAICLSIQGGMKARNIRLAFNIPKHVYDDIHSRRYYKNISSSYAW